MANNIIDIRDLKAYLKQKENKAAELFFTVRRLHLLQECRSSTRAALEALNVYTDLSIHCNLCKNLYEMKNFILSSYKEMDKDSQKAKIYKGLLEVLGVQSEEE